VKTSFNTVFNAATRQSAVNAIAYHNRGLSKTEAEDLVTAITRKHYRISESLYSDAGAQSSGQTPIWRWKSSSG
jgi:hypothetical protein